jgi:arsenite methyltransferase
VAGALTERDFVAKLQQAGFEDIEVVTREALGIDRLALYPLFTSDLLDLMRRLIPPQRHDAVAVAIVVTARAA